MIDKIGNTLFAFLFASLVTLVALGMVWLTGILMPVATVRWYLQLNAIVTPTLFAALVLFAAGTS